MLRSNQVGLSRKFPGVEIAGGFLHGLSSVRLVRVHRPGGVPCWRVGCYPLEVQGFAGNVNTFSVVVDFKTKRAREAWIAARPAHVVVL